jgi:hypothetical protein
LKWTWTIFCLQYSRRPSWNGLEPSFAFNTAAVLLEMDLYKCWTVPNGILYNSSWRTSSSCFRVVGGGNLFLTLVSKTDQSDSVIVLAWEDAKGHLRALETTTEQLQLCEWGHYFLGKLHRCSEITSGSWDASDYPTCERTPLQ